MEQLLPHLQISTQLGIRAAILPGDPARVDRVGALLRDVQPLAFNREYKSLRGWYGDTEVLVVSTGMGGPSTAIAVEELARAGVRDLIRIGSCGALDPGLNLGDLVLVSGAVRDDGTGNGYAPPAYPAVPNLDLLCACRTAAAELAHPHTVGLARSHDCLYADTNPEVYAAWSARGVQASDMETATLFVVGRLRGLRTASILNVVAGYHKDVAESVGRYQSGEQATAAGETAEMQVALRALRLVQR